MSAYNLPAMEESTIALGSHLREGREDTDLILAFIELAESFGLSYVEEADGFVIRGTWPEGFPRNA